MSLKKRVERLEAKRSPEHIEVIVVDDVTDVITVGGKRITREECEQLLEDYRQRFKPGDGVYLIHIVDEDKSTPE